MFVLSGLVVVVLVVLVIGGTLVAARPGRTPTAPLEAHLAAWREQGLIEADQADRDPPVRAVAGARSRGG